jgi:molybdopterin-containing oxidoreductase family iron-sulfur binding subunit
VKPVYRFANAKRIVSLDADFLHAESGSLYYSRSFSDGRRVKSKDDADKMNRLYVAESSFTLTGSMADHRLRLASSHVLAFTAALAGKVLGTSQYDSLATGLEVKPEWLTACAEDLLANLGQSLVVPGADQPVAVHVLAYAINARLGAIGSTVDFVAVDAPAAASISDLAAAIKAGSVKTLLILNGNPAYNAPADLDFGALLKSVPDVIRYGYYEDETSALSGTHLAATHYLESWGDARTVDGTVLPIQPMIMPLFNGLTEVELLARLANEAKPDAYEQVFATLGGDRKAFDKFLHIETFDIVFRQESFKTSSRVVECAAAANVFTSMDDFGFIGVLVPFGFLVDILPLAIAMNTVFLRVRIAALGHSDFIPQIIGMF